MSLAGTQTCDQDNFVESTPPHLLDITTSDEPDSDFDDDSADDGTDEAWIPEQPDKVYLATGDDEDSQENNKAKYVTLLTVVFL